MTWQPCDLKNKVMVRFSAHRSTRDIFFAERHAAQRAALGASKRFFDSCPPAEERAAGIV